MRYFDTISTQYDKVRGREILGEVLARVAEFARPEDLVVDVATGTGLFSIPLAAAGYHVLGLDANASMLRVAQEKARRQGVDFQALRSKAERLPLPRHSVSVMLSTNAIHHFNLRRHFREVQRALKPGGRYLIFTRFQCQNRRSIWGKLFPDFAQKETRLYTPKDFEHLARECDALALEKLDELSFTKRFDPHRLLKVAAQRKYSTFAMYSDREFRKALKVFEQRIAEYDADQYVAEIGCLVFRHIR
jgi:ubiquinone/menaquinone biosynthesis C-methylase UbiE